MTLTADRPRLEATDRPDPSPGPNEVVLRVTGCGICGSDLHVASMLAPEGSILGHEIAGIIEEVGSGVDSPGLRPGTLVSARPLTGCGACPTCRRGRPDHCTDFKLVGFDRPGGFAEYTAVSAHEVFPLPSTISADDHALIEPLAVAHRAMTRGGVRQNDRAVVIGGGPIGLALVAWLRTRRVEHIVVSEPSTLRRSLALELGATAAIDPLAEDVAAAALDGAGRAPTVVFESAGRPGLVQQAMSITAVNGRVVVVGICPQDDSYFPWTGIQKELDIRFAVYHGREDFHRSIDALERGELSASAMVTESIDLEGLPERFLRLRDNPDGGKVIVRP